MPKINKVQYIERWDALPPVLREAMFSPANGELIWKIGEEHHLKEEQIATIAGICGNIVMGFIHREDLEKEIKTSIGIDERLASAIAREIDRKVFSPLRSEIDKIYSPAGPVVEEIKMPEKEIMEPAAAEAMAGEIEPQEIGPEHQIDITEFKIIGPEAEPFGVAHGEPPAVSSVEPFGVAQGEPPVPPGLVEKTPEEPKEIKEIPPAAVELAILPKMEAPIIIHEEAEIKAVKEPARSFSLGSVFGFFKKKEAKTAEPPVVSEVELPTTEIEMEMSEEPAKVVDYNLDVQSIEQPPAPENLPVETTIQEEQQGDVIDLSSFEKKSTNNESVRINEYTNKDDKAKNS